MGEISRNIIVDCKEAIVLGKGFYESNTEVSNNRISRCETGIRTMDSEISDDDLKTIEKKLEEIKLTTTAEKDSYQELLTFIETQSKVPVKYRPTRESFLNIVEGIVGSQIATLIMTVLPPLTIT